MAGLAFQWLGSPEHSPEELERLFFGWRVEYQELDGEPAAALLLKGQEIHLVVEPSRRGRVFHRRGAVRAALAPHLAEHGFLTTRILHGSSAAAEFVRRIGFTELWRDERFVYYGLFKAPLS